MVVSRLAQMLFITMVAAAAAVIGSGCATSKKSKRQIYSQLVQKTVRQLSSSGAEASKIEDENQVYLNAKTQTEAEILIKRADEAYEKDKDSWYKQASENYKMLISEYPDHPLVPRAHLRVGHIYFRTRNCNTCDITSIYHALDSYLSVIQNYPQSMYESEARKGVRACREIIAENSIRIGKNLLANDRYEAALIRFNEGLDTARSGVKTYSEESLESEQGAEALYYIGFTYREMNKLKEAREAFLLLNNEFPNNVHYYEVESLIAKLSREK